MSETLQDSKGEILYRLGQLFQAEVGERYDTPPTFEIVVVERDGRPRGSRFVCVRLYHGDFVYKGERFWIDPEKRRPPFWFTEELVASCLRKHYGKPSEPAGVAERKGPFIPEDQIPHQSWCRCRRCQSQPKPKTRTRKSSDKTPVADVARDDQARLF